MSDTQTILHEDPVVLILAGQSQATEEDLATEARQALIRSTGHPLGADYKNIARSDWPQYVTRKQALAAGLKRYFTGQACTHGHISERTIGGRHCSACRKAAQKAYKQSERGRAANKAYTQSERGRATQKAYQQSERGTAANLSETLGFAPPKSVVKAIHAQRVLKRALRELNPKSNETSSITKLQRNE